MFSAQAVVAASVIEASGQGTMMATRRISPDDPTSTKILCELNLLAIHAVIWLLHVNVL